jgi:hypothetical protein
MSSYTLVLSLPPKDDEYVVALASENMRGNLTHSK